MTNPFTRLATKVEGALGQVERTKYDRKILDGIKRYQETKEQAEKVLSDAKETVPKIGGQTNHEQMAQAMKQTANLYGGGVSVSKGYESLGDALNKIGQEERAFVQTLTAQCYPNVDTFIKNVFPSFTKEKDTLDEKTLDMDGAKAKNRKEPNDDNALKEKNATQSFQNQRRTLETMIDAIPKHDTNLAMSLKAYTEALINLHTKTADHFAAAARSI